jgi:putative endopeptidase
MKKLLLIVACTCFGASCGKQPEAPKPAAVAPAVPALVSGIDLQNTDDSVRPQDDFYQHVNGKWLAATEIPADKGSYYPWETLMVVCGRGVCAAIRT